MITEDTRIYTVFASKGYGGPGKAPESFLTNEKLLHKLQNECRGVDFVARETTSDAPIKELYSDIMSMKPELHGVLLVGDIHGEYRLAFTGLPTIHVYNLFEFLHTPYRLFMTGREEDSIYEGEPRYENGRILTAELDRRNACSPLESEAMFRDLVYKIGLIRAVKELGKSRILGISPKPYFSIDDYHGHDSQKTWPKDYNERYTRVLQQSLGVEMVRLKADDFYRAYKGVDESRAKKIGREWEDGAKEVKAARSEIVKTAAAYIAFDQLREKHDCNAIATVLRSLTGSGKVEDMFWPGLGFECGFKTRGIQATCQDHINVLVTELLGYHLTGRPSMLGDIMLDRHNSLSILTHCGAPVNPWGDERRVPYAITTHAQSPVRDTRKPGSSTGLQVEWPIGEDVTIWKVYVLNGKIGLHTGKIVDGHLYYEDFDEIMCRTKLVTEVDDIEAVQMHQSPDEYGIHRAATLGDLRQMIKDVAALIGYEVMETDRRA